MPTYTTNLNLAKPLVNDPTDQDLWGGELNNNMDIIDAAVTNAVPSGSVFYFPCTVAPAGFIEGAGQLISRTTYANLWTFAQGSGNLAGVDTSAISAATTRSPGSLYTDGTYTNVSLTGGSGTGAQATIVVLSGVVTSVNFTNAGVGYVVGDFLSATFSGTGSGLVVQVTAVSGWDKGKFSPGDGSTTFRIPDLRGYFSRGWADAGTLDSGRGIGSSQVDEVRSHTHSVTDPGHTHTTNAYDVIGPGSASAGGDIALQPATIFSAKTGITIANYGGAETRPFNIALLGCLKT